MRIKLSVEIETDEDLANVGAVWTVQTHQELMFVIRVQRVEVHDESV